MKNRQTVLLSINVENEVEWSDYVPVYEPESDTLTFRPLGSGPHIYIDGDAMESLTQWWREVYEVETVEERQMDCDDIGVTA